MCALFLCKLRLSIFWPRQAVVLLIWTAVPPQGSTEGIWTLTLVFSSVVHVKPSMAGPGERTNLKCDYITKQ